VNFLSEQRKFTSTELAQNDGKDGKPAYIGYQGKVYDVSASPMWLEGDHMGTHEAGRDLTSEMELAPHRDEMLEKVKQIGVLV
jgi:predicted heme/steroid binding protein